MQTPLSMKKTLELLGAVKVCKAPESLDPLSMQALTLLVTHYQQKLSTNSIERKTLERALLSLAEINKYFIKKETTLPIPEISPCFDGSIDLHWEELSFEMLINFPKNPAESAGYYVDNYKDIKASGGFPQEQPMGKHFYTIIQSIKTFQK